MPFNCTCCGECCRGDMHVYLNPEDLVLIADFLRFRNTIRLFEENYVVIGTEKNGAPVPRLRFGTGRAGGCPFLENRLEEDENEGYSLTGLCRLHPHRKPLVCLLAPLHRTVNLGENTESWGLIEPLPGCPGFEKETSFGSHSGQVFPPPELEQRLMRERDFYRSLSALLDQKTEHDHIVGTLYYLETDPETDCKKQDELL